MTLQFINIRTVGLLIFLWKYRYHTIFWTEFGQNRPVNFRHTGRKKYLKKTKNTVCWQKYFEACVPKVISWSFLGFIARFHFPKCPSFIRNTCATNPQIFLMLFSLSESNSVFLVLILYSPLCLFNSLWVPSPVFHLGSITHSEPSLLHNSMLRRGTTTKM